MPAYLDTRALYLKYLLYCPINIMIKDELEKLIAENVARIGVIGLGYVGLPLIVEFAQRV